MGMVLWKFQSTYLYGVVEPKAGDHLFYEFTQINSQRFEISLQLVATFLTAF
jgi:hypothetical protein